METFFHQLVVPHIPVQAIVEPEIKRLERLETYWRYHQVYSRYKLTFKEFVAKVDAGSWNPYLAE